MYGGSLCSVSPISPIPSPQHRCGGVKYYTTHPQPTHIYPPGQMKCQQLDYSNLTVNSTVRFTVEKFTVRKYPN